MKIVYNETGRVFTCPVLSGALCLTGGKEKRSRTVRKRILAGIMAFLMVSTLWVHTGYTTYAEEGEQTLTLSWRDQEAGTLTKEEIMAELLGKETAGERYDVISIEVKDNSDRKLDYQITDEAVRILRKSSENRRIE